MAFGARERRMAPTTRLVVERTRQAAVWSGGGDSRKLFAAQHHLAADGLADHKDWRRAWYAARSAQFFIEGAARLQGGNQFARLTSVDDGTFQLETPASGDAGLSVGSRYGPERARSALHLLPAPVHMAPLRSGRRSMPASRCPTAFRRVDDGSWFVSVMLRQDFADPASATSRTAVPASTSTPTTSR
ncbi:protein of unknown function [Bradyrhizobium vignae]|uniref:Uncharacterized protein n=1 Tax=Bradyrhizobium vignae TaxID=1549949 RepID=A0A2U3PUV9_9BRAD|nr:protein of unknown function [Bradyrhizobium vignae]